MRQLCLGQGKRGPPRAIAGVWSSNECEQSGLDELLNCRLEAAQMKARVKVRESVTSRKEHACLGAKYYTVEREMCQSGVAATGGQGCVNEAPKKMTK